jgi:uncharacterized OB-fold protein
VTKFQNPSFNSPANNENYRDNYDRIFGKKARKCKDCPKVVWPGREYCVVCLERMGVEVEKPETD